MIVFPPYRPNGDDLGATGSKAIRAQIDLLFKSNPRPADIAFTDIAQHASFHKFVAWLAKELTVTDADPLIVRYRK